jgi:transposase
MRMHVPPRDRQVLQAWAGSTSGQAGLAQRALIVLLAADGVRTSEIVTRTGASKPTVATWKKRYAVEGLGGLQDRRKPGRPRRTDDAAIVLATLEPPPERLAVQHWSSRLLASELGVSNVKVAETWRQYGLEPWRREPFTFSTDPRLEAKSRAVTGLYLNPPDHAVVLCAHDHVGHGARELLTALEAVGTGVTSTGVTSTGVTSTGVTSTGVTSTGVTSTVTGDGAASTDVTSPFYVRRRHREFLRFLQQVAAACPQAELQVVAVDSYATRRQPEVRSWLARQPRIMPHFTPTQRSWLTLTEVFAGLTTGSSGTATNDSGLGAAIATVIGSWTDRSQPFAWTRPAGEFCGCRSGGDEASLANPVERP